MTWATPLHTGGQVNRAGNILSGTDDQNSHDVFWAYGVLANLRASHGYPINTFQATLRTKLKHIDPNAIVAQRLKRLPSIVAKLQRYPGMNLSRMQDIAGLRAVTGSIKKVRELEKSYSNSRFKHEQLPGRDYIERPKDSGYRSVHLVYKYVNPGAPAYDGLRIELQFRTKLQHAWATAVETMGTFLNEPLKSSQGPDEWLDFFALTSSAFAHMEDTPRVPQYEGLSAIDTYRLVKEKADNLDAWYHLKAYSLAAEAIASDKKPGSYHLITLNTHERTVSISSFGKASLSAATAEYTRIEEQISGGAPLQVVLVSTESIGSLRRAYPSYFLDTGEFVRKLDLVVEKSRL